MKEGQPTATLVRAAGKKEVDLRSGAALDGYEVLTVNPDRVVFRRGEAVDTLVKKPVKKPQGLDRRLPYLRARQQRILDLLKDLCQRGGLELQVLGELPGTVSVEFSNMSLREILDTLSRYVDFSYMSADGKLWVMRTKDAKKMARL